MAVYLHCSFISYEVVRYDHLCNASLSIRRDSMIGSEAWTLCQEALF